MSSRDFRVAVTQHESELPLAIIHFELRWSMTQGLFNGSSGKTHNLLFRINRKPPGLEEGEHLGAADFDPAIFENVQSCLMDLEDFRFGKNFQCGQLHG